MTRQQTIDLIGQHLDDVETTLNGPGLLSERMVAAAFIAGEARGLCHTLETPHE